MLGELAEEGQKEAITAGGPITMVANVFDPYGKLRDRERDAHVSQIPPLKIDRKKSKSPAKTAQTSSTEVTPKAQQMMAKLNKQSSVVSTKKPEIVDLEAQSEVELTSKERSTSPGQETKLL